MLQIQHISIFECYFNHAMHIFTKDMLNTYQALAGDMFMLDFRWAYYEIRIDTGYAYTKHLRHVPFKIHSHMLSTKHFGKQHFACQEPECARRTAWISFVPWPSCICTTAFRTRRRQRSSRTWWSPTPSFCSACCRVLELNLIGSSRNFQARYPQQLGDRSPDRSTRTRKSRS